MLSLLWQSPHIAGSNRHPRRGVKQLEWANYTSPLSEMTFHLISPRWRNACNWSFEKIGITFVEHGDVQAMCQERILPCRDLLSLSRACKGAQSLTLLALMHTRARRHSITRAVSDSARCSITHAGAQFLTPPRDYCVYCCYSGVHRPGVMDEEHV